MLKPIFVWQNKELKSVNLQEVVLLITVGNYTRIILKNDTYLMVRTSLSRILKKLPPEIFIKTHRSYAASIFFIDKVTRDHLTIGKTSVPIARQYYKTVIEQLNIIEDV